MHKPIDEKLAYFLGWIAWGNHLSKSGYYHICVRPRNRPALVYFNNLLKLNRNINESFQLAEQSRLAADLGRDLNTEEGYLRNTLSIPVTQIEDILDKFYYGARTLLKFDFPPSIPRELFGAYLRGYFEKHGSLTPTKRNKREVQISMPSYEFAAKLTDRLHQEGIACKVRVNTWRGHKDTYKIRFSIHTVPKLYRLMYEARFGPQLPIKRALKEVRPRYGNGSPLGGYGV